MGMIGAERKDPLYNPRNIGNTRYIFTKDENGGPVIERFSKNVEERKTAND